MTDKQKYKTLDMIRFNEDKPNEVILPQEVCNIQFPNGASLSLLASKLFVQLVNVAGSDIVKDKKHTVPYSALNWSGRDKEYIKEAILELQRTTVEIKNEVCQQSGQILTDVKQDYDVYSGELDYYFSKTFIKIVENSRFWATISAQAVLLMECKYSIWLYQMLAPRKNLKILQAFELSLDELKTRLGATAKTYKDWHSFKRFVLEPAIEEINFLTDILISYETVKRSRWVVAVKFFVVSKNNKEKEEVLKEHQKSKHGRKHRKQIYSQERKQMFTSLINPL